MLTIDDERTWYDRWKWCLNVRPTQASMLDEMRRRTCDACSQHIAQHDIVYCGRDSIICVTCWTRVHRLRGRYG